MRTVKTVSQCDAAGSRLRFWNESGTNRARIADSVLPGFVHRNISRGPIICGTRSSLDGLDKPRKQREFLNRNENAESNQKRARVNRIRLLLIARHSGMVRKHQTRTLEIPGSMLPHRPGMTANGATASPSPRLRGEGRDEGLPLLAFLSARSLPNPHGEERGNAARLEP